MYRNILKRRNDWICDVIIDTQYRKNGLGKKLIEIITKMKELDGMFGILATRDAQKLYEKYGFKKIDAEKYMRKEHLPMI